MNDHEIEVKFGPNISPEVQEAAMAVLKVIIKKYTLQVHGAIILADLQILWDKIKEWANSDPANPIEVPDYWNGP